MHDSSQGVVALFTHPVAANPAQFVIERALAEWSQDVRYLSLDVAPENLPAAVAGAWAMGFRGVHIDEPHRSSVVPLAAASTDAVARIQVANCLVRVQAGWQAANTLGAGVTAALGAPGSLGGKRVVLLGAGKLARSIAAELAAARVARLLVVNRTPDRGETLSALVRDQFQLDCTFDQWEQPLTIPSDCDLLINATSIAAHDPQARLPLRLETLRRETTVVDATLHPATQLLRDAQAQGCATIDGLTVYVHHVAQALTLWTGQRANQAAMREALEEFLEV